MQVKKFVGNSIAEATNKVKKLLGPNALILSTKKVNEDKNKRKTTYEIWAVPNEIKGEQDKEELLISSNIKGIEKKIQKINDLIISLKKSNEINEKIINNQIAYNIYNLLIKKGIRKKYVQDILMNSDFLENENVLTNQRVHKYVLSEIMKKLKVYDPFDENEKKKFMAFVGTTGVGKTTTIAKIAAELSLKKRKKVGLISIDNYRIGAIEQIKCYARILGVPCFPAFDEKDMKFAFKRLCEKEIILIDTAGQSHYDTSRMLELEKYIQGETKIDTHLLISTNTDENEMINITKKFNNLDIKSYIFTKTDETKNLGVIINQIFRSNIPASFITNGQKVPEDLIKATKMGIVSMLF
jgi:flagellar biosynthesis protein FlhF